MREDNFKYRRAAIGGLCTVLAGAGQTNAALEYNAVSLLNAPQTAYDISQSRPALRLNRTTMGAMNSLGQIAGTGDAGTKLLVSDQRPFFYDPANNTAANLGDLSGDFASPLIIPHNDASMAMDLNDAGWVVGLSSTSTTFGVVDDRPFLWIDDDLNSAHTAGEMRQLALNPGASYGAALCVNNSNQVLIRGDTGFYRATYELNAGVLSEIGTRSFITGGADLVHMNDLGDVAYVAGNAGFVWRDLNHNGAAEPNETTQIPFMSAASLNVAVYAINNVGQVVGTMRNDNLREVGFIWTDLDADNVVDFTDTNGNGIFEWNETSAEVERFHGNGGINATVGITFVFDINDHGVAVGGYFDDVNRRAFIYQTPTGMRYLDDLIDSAFPLALREASAINNAGQIAAVGRASSSITNQIVMLTPLSAPLRGDLDGSGFVGISDLNIILGHWNQNVTAGSLMQGDPSGDGFVGIEDLDIVLGNWNAGTPPGQYSPPIPEPSGIALLGVGFSSLFIRLGRKR